jgi:hypothetical protein
MLSHVSAAVGETRKINVACGRYLTFFLDAMIKKLRAGAGPKQLETDEELLAYASGDMQGNTDDAWAWNGNEVVASLHQPRVVMDGHPGDKPVLAAESLSTSTLSEHEAKDWGGWEYIQQTMNQLLEHQQQQRPQSHAGSGEGIAGGASQPVPPPPTPPVAHISSGPSPRYPDAPTPARLTASGYPPQAPQYAPSPSATQGNAHDPGAGSGRNSRGNTTSGSTSRISIKDIM